jgi:hypothetical protein
MPATKRRAREENVLGDVTSKIQKSAPTSLSGANGDAGAAGGLTVKGFLEQKRDSMIAEVEQRAAEQCALLRSQLAEGKDEYREELKAAKQAEAAAAAAAAAAGASGEAAAETADEAAAAAVEEEVDEEAAAPVVPTSFCVTFKCGKSGPYKNRTFIVQPHCKETTRNAVKLGRGTTKTFKEKGISLPKDSEVSTTHARLLVRDGKVFFVDAGSSNGSIVDGEEADEGDEMELRTGTKVEIGQCLFQLTVEPNE